MPPTPIPAGDTRASQIVALYNSGVRRCDIVKLHGFPKGTVDHALRREFGSKRDVVPIEKKREVVRSYFAHGLVATAAKWGVNHSTVIDWCRDVDAVGEVG